MEELSEIKSLESKLNIEFAPLRLIVVPDMEVSPDITVFMNMGWSQGVDKDRLRDILVKESGLHKEAIKDLVVEEQRSFFDFSLKFQQLVFLNIKGRKIAHRNLKLWLDEK